ncbi:ABC transporter permease [Photobacterium aphoticum]|uniref:ABC transporter n=1 Tax=Photobacterium aphoticum TaxID=754436 RepID=A0A0J1GKP6_9GAMM|nr:ABC transporter permease [Photobacterium aphoticum]KLV00290.1 ABC transporter [Photobacterium aphoticum]PSU59553.1 ABC transporter [Photobacterium aphoticum]GHA39786.1 transport permease protein [Photobacterium aphoticum]
MAKVIKRSALQIWADVVFAIFLREIKSTFSDKFGLSWALISPMIMIAAMVLIRNPFDGGNTHSMPTVFFVVYGVVLVQFFLGTLEKTANAIQKNKPLYAFRQVQPISSIMAISGFELLNKFALILLLSVLAYLFELEPAIADPLSLLPTIFKVWLLALSIGTLFALASCFVPEVNKVKSILTRPQFFISGIFFSLQDIPREHWPYLDWNPLLHAVELARYYAYPAYGKVGVSEFYLDITTIVLLSLALCCYQISWKQAISR